MDGLDDALAGELRAALDVVLAGGMATDLLAHAEQVAAIMTVLDRAFRADGLRCVLVGGGAIEVQAPGVYLSHDIDIVVDIWHLTDARARVARVFDRLAFVRRGRHWTSGELYIEVPGFSLEDPAEIYDSRPWYFTVVRKEVLLRDRLVGFKHWQQVAYGRQAVDMLGAFGSRLDMKWLTPQLRREAVTDVFDALSALVVDRARVTEDVLERVLARLRGRPMDDAVADDDE